MEENFQFYYCTTCYTCKKPVESSQNMKFCSGCKLIQYCSPEHQKRDWPNHKHLCKIIQQMMKINKIDHVYKDAKYISADDQIHWNNLRISFSKVLESILRRPLNVPEVQMVLFPPVCSYCHLYKVNEMFICTGCKTVLYCSNEHQENDKKHHGVCDYLARAIKADTYRFYEQGTLFSFIHLVDQCRVQKYPKNMELFIKSLTSTLTLQGICLSETLSYPLTLVYVISKIAKISANQLTLHLVGADSMEILAMQMFPLIYHLLPHVIHLNIVLIGPNVHDDGAIPLCIEGGNISLSSVKLLYHEYVNSSEFVRPDMIAAMNCGFCEFQHTVEKDLWGPSLPCILGFKNTVVVLTSYKARESESDRERLCLFKRNDLDYNDIVTCQENPFSSLHPHRDWESDGVYFVNKYISVIKT